MKKILKLLGLLAVASLLFVGCGPSTGGGKSDPGSEPAGVENTLEGSSCVITANQANDAIKFVVYTQGNVPKGATITYDELTHKPYVIKKATVKYQINGAAVVEKKLDEIKVDVNHPWIDGAADATKISNYQVECNDVFAGVKFKKGDKVAVAFECEDAGGIELLQADFVDQGAANGWAWTVINDPNGLALIGEAPAAAE